MRYPARAYARTYLSEEITIGPGANTSLVASLRYSMPVTDGMVIVSVAALYDGAVGVALVMVPENIAITAAGEGSSGSAPGAPYRISTRSASASASTLVESTTNVAVGL